MRSSCDAVATKARRACSWRRSSACIVVSARPRSPTSSLTVSVGGGGAAGPSRVIRRAAWRRRRSRRTRVVASPRARTVATASPTRAAARKARRTWATAVATSVRRFWVASRPTWSSPLNSGVMTRALSPSSRRTAVPRAGGSTSAANSGADGSDGPPLSVSTTDRLGAAPSGADGSRRRMTTRPSTRSARSKAESSSARAVGVAALQQAPVLGLARRWAARRSRSTELTDDSVVPSRPSTACLRSWSCSDGSSASATASSVTPAVASIAARSRGRSPRRRRLMAPGSGSPRRGR